MKTVRIIGARAGRLLGHILPLMDQARREGGRVMLLVPEQYTLQAEKELVEQLQLPGLLDMDVLSPKRLTRRIREAGGHGPLLPLDDRGRSMALAQALLQVEEELVYYRRVALTPGLPGRISALLTDLTRAGMTPDMLREHALTLRTGPLRAKETDLALIWEAYLTLISGRFQDEGMQQQELLQRLAPSGVFDGVSLWVYGFDVLPRPMCELLAEAAQVCRELTVTMVMDSHDAPDGRLFQTQRRSAVDLMELLQARGIRVEWRYLPVGSQPDGRDGALQYLEKQLFTRRLIPYEGDAGALQVHMAPNPYQEAAHIAELLRRWHEAGIPWQGMSVAMADPNASAGVLAVTLHNAGIPFYLARKDSAMRHGLCRMLTGALRCISGGYATRDVLQMAKSGFAKVTEQESQLLENYAIAHGVNRAKWTRPFTRGRDEEEIAAMEQVRQRLITPVETLRERLRESRSAAKSVEAVYLLLEEVGAYERLLTREQELLSRGMAAQAAQNRQVWQLLMGLLDQLHALLGERRASMRDLSRLMEAGLQDAAISSLPPAPDVVMLGDAGHLMTGRIEALVLCGLQDGTLGSAMSSLITEQERRTLSDAMQRSIGLTRAETAALRLSDVYRTMALPQRYLAVTCATGGQDGKALRPSGLIDDMKVIFPGMRVTGGTAQEEEGLPLSPRMALSELAVRLRAMADGQAEAPGEEWLRALRWLWRDPHWHDQTVQMLRGLDPRPGPDRLPADVARRIFSQDRASISRLEKFAACPYQHFLDYGLKPVPQETFTFEANDAGDFYHAALQGYAAAALEHPDWPNLPDEEVQRLMDGVLAPLTALWEDGPLRDSPAQRLQGDKYVRTVRRAAWLFTRHAQRSRFVTVGEEISFGTEGGLPPLVLETPSGRRVALQGKIDRIDRWQGDDGLYLRVIDYKSSQRDLEPVRLWYGLQLQLMLYLQAASAGMDGQAAGAFYFTVKDPLVSAEEAREAVEKELAKKLQLKGVVLADAKVVEAMDPEPHLAIPKIFNRDGSVAARAPGYTREEMQALLSHAQETAALLAEGIHQGEIGVSPAETRDWSACTWCDYHAVCCMDPALPGCMKRVLPPMDRQELLERLANKGSEDVQEEAPDGAARP